VSGEPLNVNKTLKVANTFLVGDLGLKADVGGLLATPKVDASACYALHDGLQVRARRIWAGPRVPLREGASST
jgi:hypothetical protein